MTTCSNCENPARAKGLCNNCYKRMRKYGDPNGSAQPIPLLTRLLALTDTSGPVPPLRPSMGPCWIWTGHMNSKGYAHYHGQASRKVWTELVGTIPDGLQLDHLCLVVACVRPEHLEPVTPAENMRRQALNRTRCRNGHDLSVEGVKAVGKRDLCARCDRERFERFYAKHGGKAAYVKNRARPIGVKV